MINIKYIRLLLVLMVGLGFILGCVPEEEEDTKTKTSTPSPFVDEPSTVIDPVIDPIEPTVNPTTTTTHKIDKEFYSNWIYIDTGEAQKIDKNFAFPIKRLGKNFIEIIKDGQKYMLLRDGSNKGIVRGRLYTDIEYVQKIDKETGEKTKKIKATFHKKDEIVYKVTINDGFFKQTKYIYANGEFSFKGVVMGEARVSIGKVDVGDIEEVVGDVGTIDLVIGDDKEPTRQESNGTEEISPQEDTTVSSPKEEEVFNEVIPIRQEDTNLGNFSIPDKDNKYNLKATKVINEQDEDDRYMYEGHTYSGKIYFKNTGKEMLPGLNYTITTDDSYVENLTYDIVMGSVEAGASVEIPFEVTFGLLDKIAHQVKLNLLIKDDSNDEWLDHIYLDVYQIPITVNLKTKTSNLKGYFITPEHEIINIDTKDIKVKIPSRPDSYYYFLVTSPKSIGAETAYSMGIDVNATDFENFQDTGAFEPNDKEEDATKLSVGDSIKSFIRKGEIDFYTIDFKENLSFEPPRLPFN